MAFWEEEFGGGGGFVGGYLELTGGLFLCSSFEMERDFLGMKGKEPVGTGREEGRVSRQDSVFGGNPSMQSPFSNKLSALQHLMSYKVGQEEMARKLVFEQLASLGFHPIATKDPFEGTRKAPPVQAQEKTFAPVGQGVRQFPMHSYQSQGNTSSCIPMHSFNEAKSPSMAVHNSIPVAPNGPFFTVHGLPSSPNVTVANLKQQHMGGGIAGSTVGAITQRNLLKPLPTTGQMTIFYAGSVCVYDDVPSDKAHAIMYLAETKGDYNASSNASALGTGMPAPSLPKAMGVDILGMNQLVTRNRTPTMTNLTPTPNHVASPRPGMPSGVFATSQTISQSVNRLSVTANLVGAKSIVTSSTNNQNGPSKTTTGGGGAPVPATPGDVPHTQARKASLARFLEKRKERVISVSPYPCTKDSPIDNVGNGPSTKSSANNIPPLTNREERWNLGSQPKSSVDSGGCPSTKLQI